MPRMSMKEVAAAKPSNQALIDATTDEDIDRQIAEDPDTAPDMSAADPSEFILRSPALEARAIRTRLGLTQEQFARRFGINIWTLREWEQHRREPDGPAQTLLRVIAHNPDAVAAALNTVR
jgi:putative transcriptional regulator